MKKYLVMILTFILMINLFIPTHVYAEEKITMEATVSIGKGIPSGEAALTSTKDTIQYTIKFHYPKEGSYILGYRYKIHSLENPLYYDSYRIKLDGKPAQFASKELRENPIFVSFPYTDSTTYTQQYQDEITFINYLFIPPDYCQDKDVEITLYCKIWDKPQYKDFSLANYDGIYENEFYLFEHKYAEGDGFITGVEKYIPEQLDTFVKEKYKPTPNIYPLPLGTSNKVYLTYDGKTLVTDFVKRLYQNTLQRNADSNGLSYWVDRLKNRTITAAQAVEGFFFSKEFLSANHNDAEFIHRCYITLLNRNEDSSGKAYWLDRLQKDNNRKAMLKSFIESNEFTALVNQYGLVRGTIYVNQVSKGIEDFVERCYTKVLGRPSDTKGKAYWIKTISEAKNVKQKALEVSLNFFHANEFVNKKVTDENFIKIAYQTFLNREAEGQGLNYWLKQMKDGKSKDDILKSISASKEFDQLMASYGLR